MSRASLVVLAALAASVGCASTGSMRNEPMDAGAARTFPDGYRHVVDAARAAIVEAGLSIEEIDTPDSNTTLFVGKKASSKFSYGEYARVAVLRTGDHETTVRLLSKKRASFNVTARGDYSQQVFALMASRLSQSAAESSPNDSIRVHAAVPSDTVHQKP